MVKKICNSIFVVSVFLLLSVPFVFADWVSGGISESENRTLAEFPQLIVSGMLNNSFPAQFDIWFSDHLGFREEMISFNAARQYEMYDRLLENSEYHIGPYGDLNYANEFMILDYAHANLYTQERTAEIGQAYQVISDWMAEQGIAFYYVQCYDKHSVYPEQFRDDIKQIGDISRTDQVITYLENETTVNTISLKAPLLEAKANGYEVYSNWGDPAHWSPRGAVVGYQYTMDRINQDFDGIFPVLREEDYEISIYNAGITLNDVIHEDDFIEQFVIRDPQAVKVEDSFLETEFGYDFYTGRHGVWVNPSVENGKRLLIMGDSYIQESILDDFAESFSEVGMVWADHVRKLPYITQVFQPDIVIFESAERVDRGSGLVLLANDILSGDYD